MARAIARLVTMSAQTLRQQLQQQRLQLQQQQHQLQARLGQTQQQQPLHRLPQPPQPPQPGELQRKKERAHQVVTTCARHKSFIASLAIGNVTTTIAFTITVRAAERWLQQCPELGLWE